MDLAVSRAAKDASIHESPVYIAHHRADVSLGVTLTCLALPKLQLSQVLLEPGIPTLRVCFITAINVATPRYPHVGVGQHELVESFVQSKAVGAPPKCEDEDGGRRVETVARGEEVFGLCDSAR